LAGSWGGVRRWIACTSVTGAISTCVLLPAVQWDRRSFRAPFHTEAEHHCACKPPHTLPCCTLFLAHAAAAASGLLLHGGRVTLALQHACAHCNLACNQWWSTLRAFINRSLLVFGWSTPPLMAHRAPMSCSACSRATTPKELAAMVRGCKLQNPLMQNQAPCTLRAWQVPCCNRSQCHATRTFNVQGGIDVAATLPPNCCCCRLRYHQSMPSCAEA